MTAATPSTTPSISPAPMRRRADAARNDQILWDTGLRLLREKGPDRLSALDLARTAGLTTGAVYARYENNEEILVGLWQNRIADPMRQYLHHAVDMMTHQPFSVGDDVEALADEILDPKGPLRAGVGMLIAAPRIQELAEVIIPEVQGWLRDLGVSDDIDDLPSLRLLTAASTAMGLIYFAAADMVPRGDVLRAVVGTQYANQVEGVEKDLVGFPPIHAVTPFNYVVQSGDPTRDALVNAASSVITRSGIERATTQRIARAAQLPPSALFATYQNRQVLFQDVVAKLLEEIYNQSRYAAIHGTSSSSGEPASVATDFEDPRLAAYRMSMITSVAQNTLGLLGPIGQSHRRLRLEFQLAAMHDEDVRAELQRVDRQTVLASSEFHARTFGFPKDLARRATRFLRTIAQGAMLLQEVSQMVDGRDVRLINARLADYASRRAIGEIPPTAELGW